MLAFCFFKKYLRKLTHANKRTILDYSLQILVHDKLVPLFQVCDIIVHHSEANVVAQNFSLHGQETKEERIGSHSLLQGLTANDLKNSQ